MIVWEYLVVGYFKETTEQEMLTSRGADGWELVSVNDRTRTWRPDMRGGGYEADPSRAFYFKRLKL